MAACRSHVASAICGSLIGAWHGFEALPQEWLGVLEGRRGAGIGTQLLRRVYAEVRAQGVEEMMIGVLATNERVRRFYEREGFAPWVLLTLGKVPVE